MPARHSREPAPTSSGFAITGGKSAGPDRGTSMSIIERASFHANPRYTLVLLDRLPSAERHLVGEVAGEAEPYGVLRPQPGSGLEYRAVSADTALLFLTLAEPGPVPTYVVAQLGGEMEQVISRLVLDAVLEIEHHGGYLSGAKAGDVVMPGSSAAGACESAICRALRCGTARISWVSRSRCWPGGCMATGTGPSRLGCGVG